MAFGATGRAEVTCLALKGSEVERLISMWLARPNNGPFRCYFKTWKMPLFTMVVTKVHFYQHIRKMMQPFLF